MSRAVQLVTDIGTTAVKAAYVRTDGTTLGQVVHDYAGHTRTGEAGRAGEIHPNRFWEAFRGAVRELQDKHAEVVPVHIVMTGQMQDVILLRKGRPVRPAILYYDARAVSELELFLERLPRQRAVQITGNTPDAVGFPAKLLWLQKHEPEALTAGARLLCGAHDYIAYRLTGRMRTDMTTASTTGLFSPQSGSWSEEIMQAIELPMELLPEPCTADSLDGHIAAAAAAELGLPQTVGVMHGMGDVAATVLGSGDLSQQLACYLGTSGWILDVASIDTPGDPERGMFNLRHPTEPAMIRVAPLLSAAGAADWAARVLSEGGDARGDSSIVQRLTEQAAQIPPGAGGVLFLPHLAGERTPFKDPDASGLFLGLRSETTAGAMFRAVLEGVAFALRSVAGLLGSGDAEEPILLSGGGAESELWPQIIADVTDRTVRVVHDAQLVGLLGTLRLAGEGGMPEISHAATPDPQRRELYDRQYRVYRELYPQLKESMHTLRAIHHSQEVLE